MKIWFVVVVPMAVCSAVAGVIVARGLSDVRGGRGIASVHSGVTSSGSSSSSWMDAIGAVGESLSAATQTVDGAPARSGGEVTSASEEKLKKILSDPEMQPLFVALTADEHAEESPEGVVASHELLEKMKNDPEYGIATIRKGLSAIPAAEYPLERASLLMVAAELPGKAAEARELAMKELTENVVMPRPDASAATTEEEMDRALSTTPAMMLPVSAHVAALRTTDKPQEAFAMTLNGIVAQKDHGIRAAIASHFASSYPDMKEALREALAAKNIILPVLEPEKVEE